ncbi:hypothetical protein AB4Y63_12280 [Leifsonia sp. YAF41]|uniref:hypothetical protein n=1 Tax=Leifsonia sp. YAF41 TaxID=3233086 RepID=UPI003F9BED76
MDDHEVDADMDAFEAHTRAVMTDLAQLARNLAGPAARVDESTTDSWLMIDIRPKRPDALAISLAVDQWLALSAGHNGGTWELGWDNEADMGLARDLIASIIAGRVEERFGAFRSRVTVSLPNGSTESETGWSGCLALLIPQPGWTRWGRHCQYAPYRSIDA